MAQSDSEAGGSYRAWCRKVIAEGEAFYAKYGNKNTDN